MRKLLLLLMLVFISTSVMAEWTALKWNHEDGGLTLYVDYTTIRKEGDRVRMLSLADFEVVEKNEVDLFSSRAQNEYDCKEKKIRQLFYSLYSGSMGKGKMEHSNSEHLKWMPVQPGSMEDAMWTAACGKKI
ncbi:MAG: surface-adhesin E family protein [Nitrosomonadaceae bacterium]